MRARGRQFVLTSPVVNSEATGDRLRLRILPATAAFLSLFIFALSANLLPAALLRASVDLRVSPQDLAEVFSLQFVAFFLAAGSAGILSEFAGRKRVFLGACLLMLAGTLAWMTARHIAQACLAAALWGAAGGIFEGMSSALLCELFFLRRKLFMNLSQVVYTLGAISGPWLAGRLLPGGLDWRLLFMGVGVLSFLLLLLYLGCRLPPTPPRERITPAGLLDILRSWPFLSLCIALFLYVLSETTIVVYANLYLRQVHGAPEDLAIYSMSIFCAAMLIGRGASAFLPEHYSYEKTIAVFLVLSGSAMALQGVSGDWRMSMIAFALAGLVCAGIWPMLVALASA
ncbi:MAG: MFS transporter, partial [Planctomycetes bacterium]|nr:MFS transporter [Planctomycetota bacterium]